MKYAHELGSLDSDLDFAAGRGIFAYREEESLGAFNANLTGLETCLIG